MPRPSHPRWPPPQTLQATALPTANFFGIAPTDASVNPCTGVSAVFDVQPVTLATGATLLGYWVAVDSAANIWGQTGYLRDYQVPTLLRWFAQIWDLTTDTVLQTSYDDTLATVGPHEFRIEYSAGTTWNILFDGKLTIAYDAKATVSQPVGGYPVQTLMEQQPFAWNETSLVTFAQALNVKRNGQWIPCPLGLAFEQLQATPQSLSGMAGRLQNPALANNQMVIGGSTPQILNGTPMWQAGSTPTSLLLSVS